MFTFTVHRLREVADVWLLIGHRFLKGKGDNLSCMQVLLHHRPWYTATRSSRSRSRYTRTSVVHVCHIVMPSFLAGAGTFLALKHHKSNMRHQLMPTRHCYLQAVILVFAGLYLLLAASLFLLHHLLATAPLKVRFRAYPSCLQYFSTTQSKHSLPDTFAD